MESSDKNKAVPIANPVFEGSVPDLPSNYQSQPVPSVNYHAVHYQNHPIIAQQQGSVHVITSPTSANIPSVTPIAIANGPRCPGCRMGVLQPQFTLCGLLFALFFFPVGIICCFLTRENICTNCQLAYAI